MDWSIKTYEPSDAASIAQMWNESDEGWPGGFTEGVPFTEQRVRDWLSEEHFIDIFLVVADQRVVAYCSLYEYAAEPTASYVALLNCHPHYWKHGFGRDLLRRAVARSTELGYKRLDLHTWPGNMRAVPLYKKTGFFWQPETGVHMLNFLPLILPLARDYFDGDDWYPLYKRELVVQEDDITWQGMKVYPYTFEKNGRMLKAVIDRESRGLTALETDDYSVACLLDGQELIAGMTSPVRWEIVNKTATPLSVSLLASGESGLSVAQKTTVEVRDRTVISGEVMVDRDIVAHDKDAPAHKITSTIVIDGRLIVLETGVRPQQAVEITADPSYISLTPGLPQMVHLRLKNNLKQPAHAQITLMAENGLTIDHAQHSIDLPAQGYSGISCTMQAGLAGAPALRAIITAESERGTVAVKPTPLAVAAPGPGKPAAYLRRYELVMENEWLRLVVQYKAATLMLFRKSTNQPLLHQRSSLGPPFYPNEFRAAHFGARFEANGGAISAILSADSRQHAGVTLERAFTLDSSPIVTIGHRLHNASSNTYSFEIRSGHNTTFNERRIVMPTAGGLVADAAPSFPDWFDDETRKPASMSETWLALEGDGFTLGTIWQGASAQEISLWTRPELTITLPKLAAYGHAQAPDIHVYAGPGDWQDVRGAWRRLVNPAAPAGSAQPRRVLDVTTLQSPLLLLSNSVESALHIDNRRVRALSGSVQVAAPPGWVISPAAADFASVNYAHAADIPLLVRRTRGKGPGAAEATVTVQHELGREQFTVPLLALGRRGGVTLSEQREHEQRLVSMDNGALRLVVAPDFVGSLVSLEQNGVNHLFSSFPGSRPFAFLNPWHGGISAVVQAPEDDDTGPGAIGRMYEEKWSYELVRPRRAAAIPWTGVRVSSVLSRERLRGLRLEMDYLTVGQSNVVAVIARLVNLTDAPFSIVFITQAYVQTGGERANAVLHDVHGRHVRRMRDFIWSTHSGRWAGVAHEQTGQCLALVGGPGSGQVSALDFGMEGAHLYNTSLPVLAPHGVHEMVSYIVLAPDVAQARLYRWLEHVQWPKP